MVFSARYEKHYPMNDEFLKQEQVPCGTYFTQSLNFQVDCVCDGGEICVRCPSKTLVRITEDKDGDGEKDGDCPSETLV